MNGAVGSETCGSKAKKAAASGEQEEQTESVSSEEEEEQAEAEGRPEPGPSGPAEERTHTGAPPDEEPAETTAPRGGGAPPAETEAGEGHSRQVNSQAEEQRGELGREEGQVAEEEPAAGVEDVGGGGSGERAGSRI
ncbi:unnamed protein product [Arctogadus glacialis]